MFIHVPASVGDRVGENASRFDIILRENMISFETPAFPFPGKTSDPVQSPPLSASVRMILDITPCAVSDFEQFLANFLRIVQSIPDSAEGDPPEVVSFRMPASRGDVFIVKDIRPVRDPERTVIAVFPAQLHDNGTA